jgi:hypothetical protein
MKMGPDQRGPFINKLNHGSIFLPGYFELDMLDEVVRTFNLTEGRYEFYGLV